MLGRLRMTIDECIKEYRDFARQAFTQKPMQTAVSENSFVPTFSADRLRDATIKKNIVWKRSAEAAGATTSRLFRHVYTRICHSVTGHAQRRMSRA